MVFSKPNRTKLPPNGIRVFSKTEIKNLFHTSLTLAQLTAYPS